MKRLSKDLADKMVMDVLIALSKQNNVSSNFAENSLDIMNNPFDNAVFTGILLTKATPSVFDENEVNIKLTVISALQTVYDCCRNDKDFSFSPDLAKEFSFNNIDKSSDSTKLHFALNQFAIAFYEYERLEKKYPELMKVM
jgi:hypothetical protein